MEFTPFPKMPRLSREIIITEKLDGTNASIFIMDTNAVDCSLDFDRSKMVFIKDDLVMLVGSRTRWITPQDDNYGFAKWCLANAEELMKLGTGHHFGEYWGQGIQRNYGLTEKRFSLFNVSRWNDEAVRPACCRVVPTLYQGLFRTGAVDAVMADLAEYGSAAVPGWQNAEGIVVWHTAANMGFKKTCKNDDKAKSQVKEAA